MKKFERLTVSNRNEIQKNLDELVAKCSPEQIEAAKIIFWATAEKAGGREEYKRLLPKWCEAIDALPNTDKFRLINEINLEMSLDIIRRALGEGIK
ncbi:MAG: hypothetical protein NTX82_02960 [Candidatus Parcubacteria bacterium]|nr:hypothetical protein [Candidatus Parcubacteria bacterium]